MMAPESIHGLFFKRQDEKSAKSQGACQIDPGPEKGTRRILDVTGHIGSHESPHIAAGVDQADGPGSRADVPDKKVVG